MNRRLMKLGIVIGITSLLLLFSGCKETKEQGKSVTDSTPDLTLTTASSEETDDTTLNSATQTSYSETSITSESETDSVFAEHKWTYTRMSSAEMEQGFLSTMKELGLEYTLKNNYSVSVDYDVWQTVVRDYIYLDGFNSEHIKFEVCPDNTGARIIYQSIVDYGAWHDSDCKDQSIVIEDNDVYVQIYYCTYEDGRIGLDVEGYIDNIHISSNVYGKENIESVEKVLLSIGINLNA